MDGRKKQLVYAILLFVLSGHAVCVVAKRDLWPFSNYSMYARTGAVEEFGRWEIVGLPVDPGLEEFALPPRALPRGASLSASLARILREIERGERDPEFLQAAALGLATMYDRSREAGKVTGEPIGEIRIYRHVWQMEQAGLSSWRESERRLIVAEVVPAR
jgi:hypothetical protein